MYICNGISYRNEYVDKWTSVESLRLLLPLSYYGKIRFETNVGRGRVGNNTKLKRKTEMYVCIYIYK